MRTDVKARTAYEATSNVGQQVKDALRKMRAPEMTSTEWKRIANDLWSTNEVLLALPDGRHYKLRLRYEDGKVTWMEVGNRCLKKQRT